MYATDRRWWEHHIGCIARDYEGRLWTQSIDWPNKDKPSEWGITCLTGQRKPGLSTDPDVVHTGSNSGYAAIGLAYHLGASRIILLGFDMMMNGNQRHWFGDHPQSLNVNSNYSQFAQNFATINCKALGIEIWNCTRRTALNCFPIYDLDEVYESLI